MNNDRWYEDFEDEPSSEERCAPSEESALKNLYMAIREAFSKWTMPIHHWKQALNYFAILYEDRMPKPINK